MRPSRSSSPNAIVKLAEAEGHPTVSQLLKPMNLERKSCKTAFLGSHPLFSVIWQFSCTSGVREPVQHADQLVLSFIQVPKQALIPDRRGHGIHGDLDARARISAQPGRANFRGRDSQEQDCACLPGRRHRIELRGIKVSLN
jgi:hypothetical protein